MGFVFGLFLGAMGDMQPLQMVNGREVPQAPFREQVKHLGLSCTALFTVEVRGIAQECGRFPLAGVSKVEGGFQCQRKYCW